MQDCPSDTQFLHTPLPEGLPGAGLSVSQKRPASAFGGETEEQQLPIELPHSIPHVLQEEGEGAQVLVPLEVEFLHWPDAQSESSVQAVPTENASVHLLVEGLHLKPVQHWEVEVQAVVEAFGRQERQVEAPPPLAVPQIGQDAPQSALAEQPHPQPQRSTHVPLRKPSASHLPEVQEEFAEQLVTLPTGIWQVPEVALHT